MAKLSKPQVRNHQAALALLEKDFLTEEEKDFVFENYHEAASNMNGAAGAFFTPLGLAYDFGLEVAGNGGTYIDLCAGIGVLSHALVVRDPNFKRLVCIEQNPEYVEIGRKLVPEAEWHCVSVLDVDFLRSLGWFDVAFSNPPYGSVKSLSGSSGAYRGECGEYKVIDVASQVAASGVFLLPQSSSGWEYSGRRDAREIKSRKYDAFIEQTGITLSLGMGIDTALESYGKFKDVNIITEIMHADFAGVRGEENQLKLFG